jgi:SAM-dependent methyltransferase
VRAVDVMGAAWRDGLSKQPWKLAERQAFRERLTPGTRLLEIGAGTGQDSAYFQDEGFAVVAADLSAVMVELCQAKGIEAYVMDFLHLDFPAGSFDAVFAMNCLLHVPNHDLPAVLAAVRAVLRPGGLFFAGVYGGNESAEGPIDDDEHVPPRFFSWRTDEQLLGFAAKARFDVVRPGPGGITPRRSRQAGSAMTRRQARFIRPRCPRPPSEAGRLAGT